VVHAARNGPPSKAYPIELKDILERASAGDESALPELKRAFDENPELAAWFGDLVMHARNELLRWAAGDNLTVREAAARQADELRDSLLKEAHSELEKLLIDRVVTCWLEVYAAQAHAADRQANGKVATPEAQVTCPHLVVQAL
jgi:hypothetical protein